MGTEKMGYLGEWECGDRGEEEEEEWWCRDEERALSRTDSSDLACQSWYDAHILKIHT